jgi:hypothetical protein
VTSYLEDNLRPLILKIEPTTIQSDILKCLGGDSEMISQQSCLIRFGTQIEKFKNKVISDVTKNLVHDNPRVTIDGKTHQVDHVFMTKGGVICYLECKCNLNLDSEKICASNEKVKALAKHFGDVMPTYFTPVCRHPDPQDIAKYAKHDIQVVGVEWLASQIDLPFTVDEYFEFLLKVTGPIMQDKGLILCAGQN